ncbi:alpha/beta fold hydrolase [Roseovarius sp. THAF9]|uniref:alpha/beta fold hydrolase n=1 Tax=Roseovarius sp. THAF9 TaxID=2587847 RepID=UPI0020C7FC02|nr:alpha/beta fold hydrolase [Roseovarius sp. THAF9]
MRRHRWLAVAALLLGCWALWTLERARSGVTFEEMNVGPTPVTVWAGSEEGPAVVMAHGFAGSRQMMQGYGLLLAQAGYRVYAYDFEGHGRHPTPMSGDVTAVDGTTRLLVNQTLEVIAAARADAEDVALVGHSMATDVLVRAALESDGIGPLVLLATFSGAVTPQAPDDMLMITGAWEPRLQGFAADAVAEASDGVRREAIVAPAVEHVAILHSRAGRAAALDWLNAYYGWDGQARVRQTGWALIGLLAAITILFAPVARLFPSVAGVPDELSWRRFAAIVGVPMLAAPMLSAPVDTQVLPVLVADYLALHLLIYGVVQLGALSATGARPGSISILGAVLVLVWTVGVLGFALDRYGANFWPVPERYGVIAALALGAVPFMLADAWAVQGAGLGRRVLARLGFLVSLAIAVALDFKGLFFLLLIAPVIVLFFLSFGWTGRMAALRFGAVGPGVGLGLALAWALGVSFPLFSAG